MATRKARRKPAGKRKAAPSSSRRDRQLEDMAAFWRKQDNIHLLEMLFEDLAIVLRLLRRLRD
jgi:hypothetical protein